MFAYSNKPFKLSLSLALESIICPCVFTIWTISSNSTLRFPWTLMLKSPISKEINCININTKYFIWWLNLKNKHELNVHTLQFEHLSSETSPFSSNHWLKPPSRTLIDWCPKYCKYEIVPQVWNKDYALLEVDMINRTF